MIPGSSPPPTPPPSALERQRDLDAALDAWCAEHPGPYRARSEHALRLIAWADHHIARIDEELARLASRRGR